jgi:hypothetical protein
VLGLVAGAVIVAVTHSLVSTVPDDPLTGGVMLSDEAV